MDQVQAAAAAAPDEPLRSEPVLAAEVAASTRSNVLHWAAGILKGKAVKLGCSSWSQVARVIVEMT